MLKKALCTHSGFHHVKTLVIKSKCVKKWYALKSKIQLDGFLVNGNAIILDEAGKRETWYRFYKMIGSHFQMFTPQSY